jgi:ribonuclease VapC
MVLDASVLVAIQTGETGADDLLRKIAAAPLVLVGAPTLTETAMVLVGRVGTDAVMSLEHGLRRMKVQIVPFGEEHYTAASLAFLRFGKGRHRASLNFGDCMAYAIASVSGLPLLYTGTDFSRTDIQSA